jgi:hypothetical protein
MNNINNLISNNHIQALLANILVGMAVLYLLYRAYLKVKNKDHSSCGGCSKCAASASAPASNTQTPRPAPQATPLIALERPRPKKDKETFPRHQNNNLK